MENDSNEVKEPGSKPDDQKAAAPPSAPKEPPPEPPDIWAHE